MSDSSLVTDLCGGTIAEVIDTKLYITWLKQTYTPKADPLYYQTLGMTVDITNTINIPASLPYSKNYTGYPRKEDISFLTNWLVYKWNEMGIETAFEKYGKWYKPQHYGFVSHERQLQASVTYDGTGSTLIEQTDVTLKQHAATTTSKVANNRLTNSENIQNVLSTPFLKPSVQTPVSELVGNVLYIYRDTNFTVNSCSIAYIRKPRYMSLALGSDCELDAGFHQTICDMAVEYMKGKLDDPQGYKLAEADIANRVTL